MQKIITLGFLFDKKDLFTNILGPGDLDGIDLRLVVSEDLKNPGVWSGILNLCARLCFETISFDGPLIVQKNKVLGKGPHLQVDLHGPDYMDLAFVSIEKTEKHLVCIKSASAQALAMVLNCLAISSLDRPAMVEPGPGKMGTMAGITTLNPGDRLTGIFTPQGLLSNCQINGRGLGDISLKSKGVQVEKQEKNHSSIFHPLNFADLYKKDQAITTQLRLNAVWCIQSSALSFNTGIALFNAVSSMVMEATIIILPLVIDLQDSTDTGKAPITGPAPLCFLVDETEPSHEPRSLTVQFPDPTNPTGQVHISGNSQGFSDHLSTWVDLALNQAGPGFSRACAAREQAAGFYAAAQSKWQITPIHDEIPSIVHEFDLGSETNEVLAAVSSVNQGQGAIFCEVWVSKPSEIRAQLRTQIEKILASRGYTPEVWVLNAFKPGLCRILDLDLPELLEKKPVRIHISYAPFALENNALELEHRWLHELFPLAEILTKELSIPEDTITLSMDDGQKEIYEFTAFDEKGNILFQDRFSPFFHSFDYMASCPELGTVSPTCAGITIKNIDQILISQAIPTDRDRFWKQFQTIFLPDLIKSMETRMRSRAQNRLQAFFQSIQVDVHIDESNFRLGFMDEQISPMEKLHEDIYFFLLKVFEQFSIKHGLSESIKLGQILPRIHSTTGSRFPWAGIRAVPARENPNPSGHFQPPAMVFDTLAMDKGGWALSGSLATLVEKSQSNLGQINANALARGYDYRMDKKRFTLKLDLPPFESDLADPGDICGPVPDDLLLTAAIVGRHLSRLNKLPHIRVWEISTSLQKRPIYAVEAFMVQGSQVSVPRLRLKKPTVFFNARHHANEISSTNAVLRFIEFLGSVPGQSYLETANAVFIPLENVDGVATFEDLYIKNSCDILHGARYNALGAEFYNEYFKNPPAFSEALAKQRLWHRWLPQLMADLHGVPSHEWCQPYAGYLPRGFREFWIPRAFVYVHLPFLEDPDHPLYGQIRKLAGTMRKAMAEDKKIMAANERITALYQKYARIPEPDVFPEPDNTELTALPLLGRARNFNFAVQYPDITRAEVIVEVPDEVAHGKNLALCVAAHYKIQETLIKALDTRRTRVIRLAHPEPGHKEFEFCISQDKDL